MKLITNKNIFLILEDISNIVLFSVVDTAQITVLCSHLM